MRVLTNTCQTLQQSHYNIMKCSISDIADIRLGHPFRTRIEPSPNGTTAVAQMKDIDESDLLHVESMVRTNVDDKRGLHALLVGDLIFKSRGLRNTVALVAAPLARTVLAAPLMLIRIHAGTVTPGYLQWYLNHPTTQKKMAAMPSSTTGRMISVADLRQFEIDVPSMEMQQRIQTISGLQFREQQLARAIAQMRQSLGERILMIHATRGPQDTG